MKQKISRVNWIILLSSFFVELVLLNIILVSKFYISIYNEMYNLVKANIVCIGFDLIFIFYMLDFANSKNKSKNILKIYKRDVNLKIVKSFIILEIIKLVLVLVSLNGTIDYDFYDCKFILAIFVASTLIFYVLYMILPKKSNLKKKISKLKKNELKIILIDGNTLPSSFDIGSIEEYMISNNHLYINMQTELSSFKNEKINDFISDNVIAIIHEVENFDEKMILEKYNKLNYINMFHIIAVKNYKPKDLSKNVTSIEAIKVCDINSAIEFTENLFIINEQEAVKKSRYKKALKEINKIDESKLDENSKEKYIKELDIIYQYNFINRLDESPAIVPKEKTLFELYRNSYLTTSSYQSILIMFDYITAIGKVVEYYLYAKNNPEFNENEISTDIIKDNPPIWNNQIIINIFNDKDNLLYKNIREENFELSKSDKILLYIYLSNMLNIDIKGDTITFDGLAEIFKLFRNRVEAHGVISDNNVYAVWNLTSFFADMYSKIFRVSKLEFEFDKSNVKIGYKGEEKVSVGKYIILKDGRLCFIRDRKSYIDYLAKEIKNKMEEK